MIFALVWFVPAAKKVPPLFPSRSGSLNFETLTGFTYRGLAPHKFTPVQGVHKINTADRYAPADFFVRW